MTQSSVEQKLADIKAVLAKQEQQQKERLGMVNRLLGDFASFNKAERKRLLESVSAQMPSVELSEAFVRQAATVGAELKSAASFRDCLTRATRRRQLSGFRNELALNNKARGYRFVRALGVSHPKQLTKALKLDDIELQANTVLKPTNGSSSNGLFIVLNERLIEVKSGQTVASEKELREKAKSLMAKKAIKRNRWVLEELIADVDENSITPARDLKFYCFYGKLGFVLEVDREEGGRYCEWLPNGERAETGRYRNQQFEGTGFTQEQAKLALSVSEQIPAAFMRIDFLRSNNQFVFGEFTPRPGQYNAFNTDFDRYLGECYLEAEARLQQDLINGKSFNSFKKVVRK
ncbi:ATP-grasp fold amidoligase family protein [Idiomarina ramblicola]|uniref:ATP-grasp domain-containing protein n=1 Tax=Idiomarina ramblicola TaxID=263724 RepID=A0A432Z1G4_9GAMM|nr:ATP-grasp fold amidoligase family protein [Idiomarina ramblicola]RUO71744.1 hypothetical protein CWI78_04305 [Idiomarina ramblicola]